MYGSRGRVLVACLALQSAGAQALGPCRFDRASLQFEGTPVAQARCLLRSVQIYGKVSAAPASLPAPLADLIGQPVAVDKARFRAVLAARGSSEALLAGSLDAPLSQTAPAPESAPVGARYFVIHDTSEPWLGDARDFPPDDAPELNGLSRYLRPDAVAHVFVNRLGATAVGHDFAVPWRATKLESKVVGEAARGLFLHVELLQPRRRDPAGSARNDAIAPDPGFTPAQYESLAMLYLAASLRGGSWLTPAFHAVLDEGLADAHDDPQRFALADFAAALDRLLQSLKKTAAPAG